MIEVEIELVSMLALDVKQEPKRCAGRGVSSGRDWQLYQILNFWPFCSLLEGAEGANPMSWQSLVLCH